MEIKVREIIFSVIILAALVIAGLSISNKIQRKQDEKLMKYTAAVQTENPEEFSYWLKTNIGDAFVEGDVTAVGAVTDPFNLYPGEYMSIGRQYQEYRKHSRVVTYTDSDGKTHTKTEYYWTWDDIGSAEKWHVNLITFCGQTYNYQDLPFSLPGSGHYRDISVGYHKRYQYWSRELTYHGTIYTNIENNTLNDTHMMYSWNLEEALNHKIAGAKTGYIVFWIFWVILIAAALFGFYYLENNWLD